ncbi:MAG: hypothetical protein MUP45_01150 [Candidatus Marinimicrobia bacterium]|nr:hypothetical protein [Candidatus Neomarinimicrobiota bacterium]
MVFIIIGLIIVFIGVLITAYLYYPEGEGGKHTFPIYRPEGSEEVELTEVNLDIFKKMELSSVRLSQTVYNDQVILIYTGVDQQGQHFSTRSKFRFANQKLVSSLLKGKRLVIETDRNLGVYYRNLLAGFLASAWIAFLIFFFGYIFSETCYCW